VDVTRFNGGGLCLERLSLARLLWTWMYAPTTQIQVIMEAIWVLFLINKDT